MAQDDPIALPDSSPLEHDETHVALLVDFDNLVPPGEGHNVSAIRHRLFTCIGKALEAQPSATHIRVRLYGGWKSSGMLSRRGSEVASIMQELDPFPLPRQDLPLLRGKIELATGLVDWSQVEFEDTYRIRGKPPRMRLSSSPNPQDCVAVDHDLCPARILKRFTSKGTSVCPVTDCSVTATQAFTTYEQKMVDTLLACDILECVEQPTISLVSVVSADTDFLPPLLYASRKNRAALQLQVPKADWSPEIVLLLQHNGVLVTEVEDLSGTRRAAC